MCSAAESRPVKHVVRVNNSDKNVWNQCHHHSPHHQEEWDLQNRHSGSEEQFCIFVNFDIEFSNNLRTENGADIEGYIKKTAAKSKITGDFLFSKAKEEKKTKKNGKPEANVNKESEALI